ncbi:MAG TPA: ATP-binding protein [Candidatus Saccharimonadales bacterium]|jgi:PAS domain S-box-containing protein
MTAPTSTIKKLARSTPIDYQQLFDSLPEGYIAVLPDDPDFTIVAENRVHSRMAMMNPENALGRPLFEVFPDTSEKFQKTGVNDVAESMRRVIATGSPDSMPTIQYDLKDQTGMLVPKYWRLTHHPIFNSDGTLALVYQATKDITQEVLAGDKLEYTQRQLNEALSTGMIGTWTWDFDTDKIICDQNTAAMFGVPVDEAANGLPLDAFTAAMHPDDRPKVRKAIAKAIKSGDVFHSEYRTISRDGAHRWLIARGSVEKDRTGKAVKFPGFLVDITERKIVENNLSYLAQASAVLSQSLDYKTTLQTIADLMVPDVADWCTVDILDDKNQLQQVALAHKDPAKVTWARELRAQQGPPNLDDPTGIPKTVRTGKPEFYPYIDDNLILASAKSEEEYKLLHDLALTSIIIVPLKTHGKTVGAITLITTDKKRNYNESDLEMAEELASRASLAMTNASLYDDAQKELAARIRLEEELRIVNEELEHRVESRTALLEETNISLQRSNQELQDFAYVASHDLQEPLRKIQAFGNLLQTEYSDVIGEGADYLDRMRNAAARMSALIEDILSFSRVTTKGREFTTVNLHTVVKEVMGDLEIRIADTQAVIEVDKLPSIHADAMQMRQLMQNLIANAIKFQRPGVPPYLHIRSTIETNEADNIKYCRLEIEDNGLGFDEKYLDRIFAVFQRLHNRDSYEGTGIGLAVCRKIIERHGGSITATSKPGKGSTFIMMLPMRHKKGENLL